MLKARADDMLIFGIEERNIELLKQGNPLHFSLAPVGLPQYTVLLYYGVDKDAVMQIFQERIIGDRVDGDTVIHEEIKPS